MPNKGDKKEPKATVVHVKGDPQLFQRLAELAETQIPGRQGTVSDEVTTAANEGLDAMHAILKMPTSKNEKLTAEACQIYADAQKKVAETRKLHAEARNVEIENAEREFRQKLLMLRLLAICKKEDEIVQIIDHTLQIRELTRR